MYHCGPWFIHQKEGITFKEVQLRILLTILSVILSIGMSNFLLGCSEEKNDNSCCGESLSSCEDISVAYKGFVERNAKCSKSEDCYLLKGFCEKGLGGCYEAVAAETQAAIDAYSNRWIEIQCSEEIDSEQCDCAIAPDVECSPEQVCRIVQGD